MCVRLAVLVCVCVCVCMSSCVVREATFYQQRLAAQCETGVGALFELCIITTGMQF